MAPEPVPRSTTTGSEHPGCLLDRPARQQLGLGPGHEDARPDDELDVPEPGASGQVLERLAARPAGHQCLEGPSGLGVDLVDEHEPGPVDAEDVGQQDLRVGERARDAGVGQAAYGVRRPGHGATWAAASRRVARSASMQESRTGWRSPSSTASRL